MLSSLLPRVDKYRVREANIDEAECRRMVKYD